jgi:dTDP-4-dehydrorhamnose reductase
MKKILVTGADGQVGNKLVNIGNCNELEIIGYCKSKLDITCKDSILAEIKKTQPALIINAAAYTNVDMAETNEKEAFLINHYGVENIANVCAQSNIPLFHISTDYVFDGTKNSSYKESDSVAPINTYARSKLAGELAIRKILKKYLILRTSWVFSERKSNFLKTIIKLAKTKKEIEVVNDQYGGPTSAKSIAKVLLDLSKVEFNNKFEWGIYHFCQGPYVSWYEFAKYISAEAYETKLIDRNLKILPISSEKYAFIADRPENCRLSNKKLFKYFDIKKSSWKEDVKETINILKG